MELDAPLFNMSPLNKSSAGPSHGKPRLRQKPYAVLRLVQRNLVVQALKGASQQS